MNRKKAIQVFAFILGMVYLLIIALYNLGVLSLKGLIISACVAMVISLGGIFIIRKTE